METRNVEDKPEPRTAQNRAEIGFAVFMILLLPLFVVRDAFIPWGLLLVLGIILIERAYAPQG